MRVRVLLGELDEHLFDLRHAFVCRARVLGGFHSRGAHWSGWLLARFILPQLDSCARHRMLKALIAVETVTAQTVERESALRFLPRTLSRPRRHARSQSPWWSPCSVWQYLLNVREVLLLLLERALRCLRGLQPHCLGSPRASTRGRRASLGHLGFECRRSTQRLRLELH